MYPGDFAQGHTVDLCRDQDLTLLIGQLLLNDALYVHQHVATLGLDFGIVRRVVRIGTPVSLHGIVFSGAYIVIVNEVYAAGGDAAAAALGLGIRLEGVAYMVGVVYTREYLFAGIAIGAGALLALWKVEYAGFILGPFMGLGMIIPGVMAERRVKRMRAESVGT